MPLCLSCLPDVYERGSVQFGVRFLTFRCVQPRRLFVQRGVYSYTILPDSDVLIAENESPPQRERVPVIEVSAGRASPPDAPGPGARGLLGARLGGTPQRAASELELRRARAADPDPDSASLQDEPLMDRPTGNCHTTSRLIVEEQRTSFSQIQKKPVWVLKVWICEEKPQPSSASTYLLLVELCMTTCRMV